MPEARSAVAVRESRVQRLQGFLGPQPASVRAARALVERACHVWDRRMLLQDTLLIASELAANAVEHARTDFVVTVSRGDTRLHVAIHDCASTFPHPTRLELVRPRVSFDERGRGLRLVHATAAAWGSSPTRTGKLVWATVR